MSDLVVVLVSVLHMCTYLQERALCQECLLMLLLDAPHRYNINAVAFTGFTPLVVAIINGNAAIVRECLRCGADVDQPAPALQCTPLVAAILCQHEEIVEELLRCGPNPFRALPNGVAPIHAAVVAGNIRILTALVRNNNKLTSVRVRAAAATTPLHLAAYLGSLPVAKCLLELIPRGDVGKHITSTDNLGRDALFIAVQNFHADIVVELLKRRADPNRCCAHGHHFATTPLGVAVYVVATTASSIVLLRCMYVCRTFTQRFGVVLFHFVHIPKTIF